MVHVATKVFLLLLLFFIAACPGLKFLRLVGINKRSNPELFVLSTACGFAIISEGLLILGMMGLFTPLSICLVVLLLFVASAGEAAFFFKAVTSSLSTFSFRPSSQYVVIGAFSLFVIINIFKALLPPHGPTDVLYYHMTLPKLYLANGAIVTYTTFFPSFFPSNGELLFALSLVLGGPVLVNLTHFGFALLTVMALYAYAQKYFRKEYAILPGILYLTAPVINSWGTMAYTGNILGFYLFLLCMLVMEENSEKNWKNAVVWGVITGMALGIKYQAIPLVGILCFFFVFIKRKEWRRFLPLLTFALIIGIIVASPWFLRNTIVTKNPFFPILRDLFPSEIIFSETTWGTDTKGKELLLTATKKLQENPFSPFAFLFSGSWRNDDYQRFIGPLFLCLAPFFLLLRRIPIKWPLIVLVCLLSYLSALFLRGNIRYVILLVIFLAFIGGAVGQEMLHFAKRGGRIFLTFFLSAVILLYSVQNYHLILSHKRILTSLNPRLTSSFLRSFERSYQPAVFANHQLPSGAKVLFHGFARYFYFNYEPLNDCFMQRTIVYDEANEAEDVLHIMRTHGISHIISQDVIPERARSATVIYDEDPRFVEFTQKYLEKIFSANGISIYRIKFS